MPLIKITPEELVVGADALITQKEVIIDAINKIKTQINDLDANWDGAANSSFIEGFRSLDPLFNEQFPGVIDGLAAQLKGAAQGLENADTEIANQFKQ